MISKTDLWDIINTHMKETGQEFTPIMKNHIIEIVESAFKHEGQEHLVHIPTYEEVIKMREDYMKNWKKINPDYPENDYYSGINDGLFLFYNKLKK